MKHSLKTGLSFGLTSGVITTLGLMVGLSATTNSKVFVLGGILTIAIADAFSDSLGIHVSEESENKHTQKEIWESTIFTFIFKFLVASTFLVPVLLFELPTAVLASIIWGLLLLAILSFAIAKAQNEKPFGIVAEHLIVALVVVAAANYAGSWIATTFG